MRQAIATMERDEQLDDGAYQAIGKALTWLAEAYLDQPSLADAAAQAGLSPYHFQRLFTRYVGVSPKKFVQHLTLSHAKQSLAEAASVLDAAYDAGLSGPSRLHDLFITHEAMTPGEWKLAAADKELRYGWHLSPFGDCLIIATERGVCGLGFALDAGRAATLANLAHDFGRARLIEDPAATAPYAAAVFGGERGPVHLILHGTALQLKVWEALLRIPQGAVVSYGQLAASVGRPTAARAVASAVARNSISLLIPCHRVIRATGALTHYRWQPERKRALLAWEAAHDDAAAGVAA